MAYSLCTVTDLCLCALSHLPSPVWRPLKMVKSVYFLQQSIGSLKEGCHLFDTTVFMFFITTATTSQCFPCIIFRYSGPETRIPKSVHICHRKGFASLFCILAILPMNLTTSFQFWRKLVFFPRKVTYFVLAKQIWIPYYQNSFFSFVKFPYEGKNLAAFAEEMPTTVYLHMETLKKLVVKYPYLFWLYEISHFIQEK